MEKSTAEKLQRENRPVWIMGIWTALPIEARIAEIYEDDQKNTYAKVAYISDKECNNHASYDVLLDSLYPSKEDMLKAMYDDIQAKTVEIRASIRTKDDCIRFMFKNTVSCAGVYTDWTARRTIQKISRERWGMELE